MAPTLPESEWITPREAIEWIAARQGWSADDWALADKAFRQKWSRAPIADDPLLAALDADVAGPLSGSLACDRFAPAIATLKAARGIDAAALAADLRADLQKAEAHRDCFDWAEQDLIGGLERGWVKACGKPMDPEARGEEVPLGQGRKSIPVEVFREPVGFELFHNKLTLAFESLGDIARWAGPDWHDVRVSRADVMQWWSPPKPRDEPDPLAATSWTLLEALAWVAMRDADAVRKAAIGLPGHWEYAVVPNGQRRLFKTAGHGPSLETLGVQFVARALKQEQRMAETFSATMELLRGALSRGAVSARGLRDRCGNPQSVPAEDWDFLEFADDHRQPCARPSKAWSGGTGWYELRFPVEQIIRAFPAVGAQSRAVRASHWKSPERARALYAERVASYRDLHSGRRPTEDEDQAWRLENRVRRDDLRKLRTTFAVGSEHKGGRRAKLPEGDAAKEPPGDARKPRAT